ncbi:hypothetical protein ABW20_dc0104113 [Dactylellina cionopaga]|nr:hypothetical protein ABW20_dc0104113 [Dactylellina cionopaga]
MVTGAGISTNSGIPNIDGLEALDGLCMDISRGAGKRGKGREKIGRETGCEVVQLHGDLEMLRCTQCAKLHDYDQERVETLLGGDAPECPDCSRKADDRLAAGKRSINVGGLRPNIVLYDEMHPLGDAIGQLTHYDATRMTPDLLLIFGTSLKVIGLKRIVKAFAAKVKSRGGKVVYINSTPASDSIWGDIIDFHIQMDCDAWIKDLKLRRKEIWLHQSLLDKEWKKTKFSSSVSSLKKSKTTTGYESDKENGEGLKGQPLVRRKSLSSLPSKKKPATSKEKQLLTPTKTPRKLKPKSLPGTPAGSTSKRSHNAAFPPSTSPLTALHATPICSSFLNTPNKRARLASTPLPPMNATTPPHWNRIQDLRTPQRPSPGAYSWLTSSRASSTRSSLSTPTQQQYLSTTTPDRPIPESPTLTEPEPSTPSRSSSRRFFLDHIAVPSLSDFTTSPSAKSETPSTPRRSIRGDLSSVTRSGSTSARRSARRHGVSIDEIFVDGTPSPSPSTTPTRGPRRRSRMFGNATSENSDVVHKGRSTQLPTPPDSQIPSDQDREEEKDIRFVFSLEDVEDDADDNDGMLKYRPRNRSMQKKRVFVEDLERGLEKLDSDVSEASEQLEREAEMMGGFIGESGAIMKGVTVEGEEEEEIEDVDLVQFGSPGIPESMPVEIPAEVPVEVPVEVPEVPAEVPVDAPLEAPAVNDTPTKAFVPMTTSEDTPKDMQLPKTAPGSISTPTPISKGRRKTSSPAMISSMERRRTRGLEKDEAILKVLTKPGIVTRREAERRKSLKAEFKGLVSA